MSKGREVNLHVIQTILRMPAYYSKQDNVNLQEGLKAILYRYDKKAKINDYVMEFKTGGTKFHTLLFSDFI